ncbi:DUF4910 domain-containing protein [Thalassobacillus sp. B23F22_16]|uniref:DUF4910 domain-containing protein n=1 Tax=Thalassobacillus sp. B23F22_16 TaxID=3459513 RepID=UPI00373E9D77
MNKFKKKAAVLLSAVMLSSGLAYSPAVSLPSADAAPSEYKSAFDQKVIKRFQAERSIEHIAYLSEEIGPRVTGTEAEQEAADYIKNLLNSYGYEVEEQEFAIPDRMSGILETVDGNEVQVNIPSGSGSTDTDGITGLLFDAGLGYPEDFSEKAEGKIALISRGEFSFAEKTQNAVEAGAVGVLIYNNAADQPPLNMSLGDYESPVPLAGLTMESGQALLEDVAAEEKEVTFAVERLEDATSTNIIASKSPKHVDNPEIVHVTAHFDSVPYAPGANDNASGTSVVLELARILKSYPVDKELRFAFFGAEEIGLVGSEHYVSELSEDEVSRSIGNFNLDMVGTNWEEASSIYMNTLDGQANTVTESAEAAAERIGTSSPLTLYQRGASDHVSFYEGGIDAVNFIRREPETANLEPYYHTPDDLIQYISEERLQEIGELVGAAVYELIRK